MYKFRIVDEMIGQSKIFQHPRRAYAWMKAQFTNKMQVTPVFGVRWEIFF
jgi:hypothetical protein